MNKHFNGVMTQGANGFHGQKPSVLITVFAGRQDRHVAFSSTPALARTAAANEGIVDSDDVTPALQIVAMPHGDADLFELPTRRAP